MRRFRHFQRIERRGPAAGDLRRQFLQSRMLNFGGVPPCRQFTDPAGSTLGALRPISALSRNGGSTRGSDGMFLRQGITFAACCRL